MAAPETPSTYGYHKNLLFDDETNAGIIKKGRSTGWIVSFLFQDSVSVNVSVLRRLAFSLAGQPPGSRGRRVPVAHKQGADRSGSGDSRSPHASIVPRQSCGTRRSIIVGLRPRQLRFALLQFFLSGERNRTAACGRGKVKTRCNESKCAAEKIVPQQSRVITLPFPKTPLPL